MNSKQTALTSIIVGVTVLWGLGAAAIIGALCPLYVAILGWVLLAAIFTSALASPFRNSGLVSAIICSLFFLAVQLYQTMFMIDPRIQPDNLTQNWLSNTVVPILDIPKIALISICLVIAGLLGDILVRQIQRIKGQLEQDAAIIQELTVRDGLTGAVKRSYTEMMLTAEIERSRRYKRAFSVILLGPDDWPSVVRERGRDEAVETLRAISEVLLKGVRTMDIVSRYDESRFLIVLPETPSVGAANVADRLCREVMALTSVRFRSGMAEFPIDGAAKNELLDEAEAALEFARRTDINVATRSALA
ncbi:MAG: GGDEF domain-containing protein [Chloroflexota bacterium]